MTDPMRGSRRDYLPDQLRTSLQAAGFDGTIALQARQMVEETTWLLELAEAHEFIHGAANSLVSL